MDHSRALPQALSSRSRSFERFTVEQGAARNPTLRFVKVAWGKPWQIRVGAPAIA
jgi:hypothetical protein